MKHIFQTSALAISMIVPAFAETTAPDIAAGAESATCDSGTLNTTDGTSTLSAQWTANTITLKFYGYNNEQFATNTCTYDGGITLPSSAPRRTGYNFAGWQVKQALFDLRTLEDKININGISLYAHGTVEGEELCWGSDIESEACTDPAFSDISIDQWKVEFSYGTVKGKAKCSNTTYASQRDFVYRDWYLDRPATDNLSDTVGGYCWCQVSGYAASGSSSFANISLPVWVMNEWGVIYWDDVECESNCVFECVDKFMVDRSFRRDMYGVGIPRPQDF
nr:InlB B-repeat-containing protein [Candidatus Enterousia merdequi]